MEAKNLERDIIAALDKSHPKRCQVYQVKAPQWWTDEAQVLQRKVKSAASKFRSAKSEGNHNLLTDARREFSKLIRKLKRKDWQKFCEEAVSPKQVSRLHKIMQKRDNRSLGILKRADQQFCESPEETMNLLMDTHFPGSRKCNRKDPPPKEGGNHCDTKDERTAFITPDRVRMAIMSFGSLKAAGMDDIKPIALKHLGPKAMERLTHIYRASSLLGYIPRCWRTSKVIFIPKPGKKDYAQARSFRPISLTPFLLKGLEKIWAWQLEATVLKDNPFSKDQHGFRKGYSTESALSTTVEYIEQALVAKSFALATFLDIQGAFDNVPIRAIVAGMRKKGMPAIFIKWYTKILTSRRAVAEHQGIKVERHLEKGTPQGGVLSTLIWNVVFDGLLELFKTGPVKVGGFADDARLITIGDYPSQLAIRMQVAVDKAVAWGRETGLQFSAAKTVVVLFTHKRKFDNPPPIRMGGGLPYRYQKQSVT
jgi:hypothetical protein